MLFQLFKISKKQVGFCSKCHCFMESSAHWTLLHMTTSTLHMFRNNNVSNSFPPRASSGSILDLCSFKKLKISKKQLGFCYKCHCFVGSKAHWTRLYITTATLNMLRDNNVINSFPPRASSGSILDFCSFRNSKFQKSKLDSALNVTVSWDQVHIGHFCT